MADLDTQRLVKVSDSDLMIADAGADVRGREVVDRDEEEIGTVDDLWIDEHEQKVRFLEVRGGGFLGFGGQHRLIPVDSVTGVDQHTVRVGQTRARVQESPVYDPELTPERDYWQHVYGYYGTTPFWGGGYLYPTYPVFPPHEQRSPAGREQTDVERES